jgi:hypothetical protein
MKQLVMGYVGTLAGVVVGILALASLGSFEANLVTSAILALLSLVCLGVGWYGLRHSAAHPQEAE